MPSDSHPRQYISVTWETNIKTNTKQILMPRRHRNFDAVSLIGYSSRWKPLLYIGYFLHLLLKKKIFYYLAPVTVLPYCSQILCFYGLFPLAVAFFLCIDTFGFEFYGIYIISSEILFSQRSIFSSFTFLPLAVCHKSLVSFHQDTYQTLELVWFAYFSH